MATIVGFTDNDVELLFPGDRFPVSVGPALRASGWRGGTFVQYAATGEGDYVVEISDGNASTGFILFQSENNALVGARGQGSPNNWTNIQPRATNTGANVVTVINGGTRALFRVFETVALAGGTRSGGAITYGLNQDLKVSENGLLCNDADAALALAGVATPRVVGMVSAVPSNLNNNRLSLDMKF